MYEIELSFHWEIMCGKILYWRIKCGVHFVTTLKTKYFGCINYPWKLFFCCILLTVHLGIILVNNQLDAFFQCIYFTSLHVSSNPVLIIRRIEFYQYIIWYISLCVGDCLVCRSRGTSIPGSHLHRVIHIRWCIDTIDSPDDEHWVSRNM